MVHKRSPCVVYHFILDPRAGGPHTYVALVSKVLSKQFDFIVVTGGGESSIKLRLLNLRNTLRALYPLEIFINAIKIYRYFKKRVRGNSIIIDVHGAANLAPIIAAFLLKRPVVWHFHETEKSFVILVRLGKRLISKLPHSLVAVANKSKEVYSLPDAHLIPGGIDTDFWNVSEPSKPRIESLKLLAVGNLNPLKGFDLLLESLESLEDINMPIKLTVVGARLHNFKLYTEALMKQANKLKRLNCDVEFLGWQSPDSVRTLMRECDIFVLPSRSEACPLVLLEAMACGCACIATDVGDVGEILKHGEGLLIEAGDPAKLRDGLRELYRVGGEARAKKGRIALKRVEAFYGSELLGSRHRALYDDLLSRSGAKP